MIQLLLLLISVLFYCFWFGWKLKSNFHMLQQNSYFNGHYLKWCRHNIGRNFYIREFLPLLLFTGVWCFLKQYALLLFGGAYFLLFLARPKHVYSKKPLVITARVKRLIGTASVLGVVLFVLLAVLRPSEIVIAVALTVLSAFSALYAAAVNLINRPMELGINRWYYRDAQKKIESMPHLKVVGITGSYGKTSTKYILTKILAEKYNVLMTPESYNTTMGVIKTVRMQLKSVHEVFVCEMGAKYVGDIKEICDLVHPQFGLITSIGPQHLETFHSTDNIVNTKYELAESISDKSKLVLNLSSPLIRDNQRYPSAVAYGEQGENGAMYWAENIVYGNSGTSFIVKSDRGTEIRLETRLLGKHNILNIVGAVAIAELLGVEPENIRFGVKKLQPVPHRLEMKPRSGNITIIDDAFNSNVEGAKSAVEVLGNFAGVQRILITPGMIELGDKQYEYNYAFGKQAAAQCDYILLVGEKQTVPIQEGVKAAGFPSERLFVVHNLQEALGKMRELATEPSVVLLENDLPDLFES